MGGIFWYWPFPAGARKEWYWAVFFGIGLFSAGLDVLSAFFGWFFEFMCGVDIFVRREGGRREPGGGGDWSPDPQHSSQDLRPCKTGAATAAEARCTIKKRPWPLPKASSTQILT